MALGCLDPEVEPESSPVWRGEVWVPTGARPGLEEASSPGCAPGTAAQSPPQLGRLGLGHSACPAERATHQHKALTTPGATGSVEPKVDLLCVF
jgi:hypothetical protein